MHNIDKMYFINSLKSGIKYFNKINIGMKIFIIGFFIFINCLAILFVDLEGKYLIIIILSYLNIIYTAGGVGLLEKIQDKYREKYNKDAIIKNAGETHNIFVEEVSSTSSEVETNYIYANDPDYKKEHAKWAKNFIIYQLGILVPLFFLVYI